MAAVSGNNFAARLPPQQGRSMTARERVDEQIRRSIMETGKIPDGVTVSREDYAELFLNRDLSVEPESFVTYRNLWVEVES